MKIGIFTQWIRANSVEELADQINGHGLNAVVLDSFPGLNIDLDDPSRDDCLRIRRAFEGAGVEISAVGGYSNLVHHDSAKRGEVHRRFRGLMKLCHEIGSPMLCSETGTYHPRSDWHWDPANGTEQAFGELVRAVRGLLGEAESYGVTLGFEPYVMNIAYTASRARRFIEALDSDYASIVMDPAGLLTRATLDDQEAVMQDMFDCLGPYIGLIHVEDCLPNGEDHFDFLGVGKGALNYPVFMKLIAQSSYTGPLILEHLRESELEASRRFVVRHWEEAGGEGDRNLG